MVVGSERWGKTRLHVDRRNRKVERLSACGVIGRIDDFGDFRGDPFHHDFESLPQSHLRRGTALTAAAHGDEQPAVAHRQQRNFATVLSVAAHFHATAGLLHHFV